MAVDPAVGPVGTKFVFTANLGTPLILRLFHDGMLARQVLLNGNGWVSYTFASQPGDEGSWVATAVAREAPECGGTASFAVLPPHAMSTPSAPNAVPVAPETRGDDRSASLPLIILAVMVVVVLVGFAYLVLRGGRSTRREGGR